VWLAEGALMMRLPPFRYFAPRGVAEAIGLLAEHGGAATVVAGGTDLYPNMKRLQMEPRVLVGLRRIRELAEIRGDARSGLTIGAGATLTRVSQHRGLPTTRRSRGRPAGLDAPAPQHGDARWQRQRRHANDTTSPKGPGDRFCMK
jgi:hypothetical protein